MSPFKLSSCCSCHVCSYYFAQFLLLKRVTCLNFFFFTTKTTQPRLQVFSVKGALTCKTAAFWRHRFIKRKILPDLVISSLLWWINYACAFSQSESGKYFEWIIRGAYISRLAKYNVDCTYYPEFQLSFDKYKETTTHIILKLWVRKILEGFLLIANRKDSCNFWPRSGLFGVN